MTPEQRALRARLAAHTSWAHTENPSKRTQPARDAQFQKFVDEVDPDGELSPEERLRRAEHARKAHMKRLALRSSRKRQQRGPRDTTTSDEPDP